MNRFYNHIKHLIGNNDIITNISAADSTGKFKNTMRISWMVNNAIPDSTIMNVTCWSGSLVSPVEPLNRRYQTPDIPE